MTGIPIKIPGGVTTTEADRNDCCKASDAGQDVALLQACDQEQGTGSSTFIYSEIDKECSKFTEYDVTYRVPNDQTTVFVTPVFTTEILDSADACCIAS